MLKKLLASLLAISICSVFTSCDGKENNQIRLRLRKAVRLTVLMMNQLKQRALRHQYRYHMILTALPVKKQLKRLLQTNIILNSAQMFQVSQ